MLEIRQTNQDMRVNSWGDNPVDKTLIGWLNEVLSKSHSEKTKKAYITTIQEYRNLILAKGKDLFFDPPEKFSEFREDFRQVATGYAQYSKRNKPVAAATIAQRYAILSSFYTYAIKQGKCSFNPIDGIKRVSVQAYAQARPLEDIKTRLKALKEKESPTLKDKRDYAMILLFVTTGRRASEIARLVSKDLDIQNTSIIVKFKTKGNKIIEDSLDSSVCKALLEYISLAYPKGIRNDDPLWISTSHFNQGHKGLTIDAIADIFQEHLGISKIHATRHTFAKTMEKSGAPISVIQKRLGHSNAATTSRYLEAMDTSDNPYLGELVKNLGIEE